MTRTSFALLLCVLPGCALAHEVSVDANRDTGGSAAVLAPCSGGGSAGTSRDCGWFVSGAVPCRPGATMAIGCNAACGLGSCTGDSMIRVCDSAPCTSAQALAFVDDGGCAAGGGVCSFIPAVNCPPSGQLFVLTAPFSSGQSYTCNISVR